MCCEELTTTKRRYLYYALSTVPVRPFMSGSVQAKLSQTNLNKIPVPYFTDASERRAIVRVLGALDDRIELNRRMSETIEEMAWALFRSWFVDFDPVRAKAEGRPSGLPPALDALFPASFEASELGEIPAGWEVKTLGDIFELAVGGAWGKDAPDHKATELVHCLRGIDCHALAEDRVPEAPVRWLTPRQLATRRLPPGTILIRGFRLLLWKISTLERRSEHLLRATGDIQQFCQATRPDWMQYLSGRSGLAVHAQSVPRRRDTTLSYRDGLSESRRTLSTVDPERCSASRSRRRSVCAPVRSGRPT